jgi:hypothetical protein
VNTPHLSAGARLRAALDIEQPLQIVGTINAYSALMAERVGFRALYISGAGVANASYGLPDLALTTLNDVLEDVRRITSVTDLPVLVDIDTGWGNALMINRVGPEKSKEGLWTIEGQHLAFGKGIHYCLGAPLARMEGQLAINALLRRMPNLRLNADVHTLVWRPGTFVMGLRALPLAF